ncbi:MAG: zinc ribbon domain-containing protein [Thermodesulfobacteria bacterium]|nr:zinc ribbon domain-containing protein [Thermodesulfobacteriota bacterium]
MPIYEYKCLSCGKVSEHLVFNENLFVPYCKWCGSKKVEKLISRVKVKVSLERRLEKFTDESSFGDLDSANEKTMKKFMEKMGAEFGSELGDEFDEVMEAAKTGALEEEVSSSNSEVTNEEGSNDSS